MRVTRWELKDFGSHRHTVLEPGDARLVVITGENGVGKTTLASEALGHALYKDDRGTINAGVRNGATESAVSIDFEFAGSRYRAIRRRTIRAGGKSSADLQVQGPGGAWSPVASGDKEVPAAIRELIRMDKDTFRTAVSLQQKDLDRFVRAAAAGRHEVLASIVVDPKFRLAAKLASTRALELEAGSKLERDQVTRLDDAIAELAPIADQLVSRQAELARFTVEIATATTERTAAEDRIRALEVRLAAAGSTTAEIARIEAELADLIVRYREAQARRAGAATAAERAQSAITAGEGAAAAAAGLGWQRDEVTRMEDLREQDAALETKIRARREALALASADSRQDQATWTASRDGARSRADELAAAIASLVATPCPKCGTPVTPGSSDLQARKDAAGAEYLRLEANQPHVPLGLATEAAQISRLEDRRRELGYGPASLVAFTTELRRLEALAARADAVTDAQTSLDEAQAAIAAADADLERISADGVARRARRDELTAAAAETVTLAAERATTTSVLRVVRDRLTGLETQVRATEGQIARLEGNLDRLAILRTDRGARAASLAIADVEIGRLRKLTVAFGLKGIPARVIESVLPELGRNANEVLGSLFGMSLEIRAQRATADGKGIVEALDLIVRHETAGELELERISGGQETAVSLALAIGLSRLNARRAGTAIRTLVIDEPEGLSATRRRALGQALRQLAHEGELELVVAISHAPELAEFADLVVDLRDGPDGVEMFIDGLRVDPDEAAAIAA